MHKPPRQMHISTGRFPLSRRPPSRRRAFLGVFSITRSFGRHDKCQRPRISPQIKRCQPITSPIIRRKHREIPIFSPEVSMQGSSIAEYSQKCTSPPPPHGANQNKSAANRPRAIFIQINYCPLRQRRARRAESKLPPGAFRRTQKPSPHEVRSEGFLHVRGRAGRELALRPGR